MIEHSKKACSAAPAVETNPETNADGAAPVPVKRSRGRPRKHPVAPGTEAVAGQTRDGHM